MLRVYWIATDASNLANTGTDPAWLICNMVTTICNAELISFSLVDNPLAFDFANAGPGYILLSDYGGYYDNLPATLLHLL